MTNTNSPAEVDPSADMPIALETFVIRHVRSIQPDDWTTVLYITLPDGTDPDTFAKRFRPDGDAADRFESVEVEPVEGQPALAVRFKRPVAFWLSYNQSGVWLFDDYAWCVRIDFNPSPNAPILVECIPTESILIQLEHRFETVVRTIPAEIRHQLWSLDATGSEVPYAIQLLLEESGDEVLKVRHRVRLRALQRSLNPPAESSWYDLTPSPESP